MTAQSPQDNSKRSYSSWTEELKRTTELFWFIENSVLTALARNVNIVTPIVQDALDEIVLDNEWTLVDVREEETKTVCNGKVCKQGSTMHVDTKESPPMWSDARARHLCMWMLYEIGLYLEEAQAKADTAESESQTESQTETDWVTTPHPHAKLYNAWKKICTEKLTKVLETVTLNAIIESAIAERFTRVNAPKSIGRKLGDAASTVFSEHSDKVYSLGVVGVNTYLDPTAAGMVACATPYVVPFVVCKTLALALGPYIRSTRAISALVAAFRVLLFA